MNAPTPAPTTASTSAVVGRNVTVAYGDNLAVHDVSFEVPRGALTAVIGPNGSGKTTLLRAMSALERVARGELEVLGHRPGRGRGDVAHVLQATKVNDAVPLTVREVVSMGRYARLGLFGWLRGADHTAVDEAMQRMGVTHLANRHLRDLSGGQQQRVYVAQGLAQQADVLLLDEPLTGLDLPSQERIDRAVADELAAGRTVIVTTHDVATAGRADHVLLLATHVVSSGPPEQALTEECLGHAYGGTAFRTADGTIVIGDPHVHGTAITGHDHHH
jgi:ABC-type Mn2+/Zn2+ transport system ATPase subunit